MTDVVLQGRELQEHIVHVQLLAADIRSERAQGSDQIHLRDMAAWTELRRAQEWLSHREAPRCAWQGGRVRRTALQLGYRRPVMEGRHIGLMRPAMTCNQLTYEVAVFPDSIIDHTTPYIAAELIHEATHIVTRELFCERTGMSAEEALVVCDLNPLERERTIFIAEALAFWNQVSWLLVESPHVLQTGEQHWMFDFVVHAINHMEAAQEFAEALMRYTLHAACHAPSLEFCLPFVHLYGRNAGLPVVVGDLLAPDILNPLLNKGGY